MKSMTGRYFLDTNFFVYLFSKDEVKKREICYRVFQEFDQKSHVVISTQVLKEFAAVMIGKIKMDPLKVKNIIDDLSEFEVIDTNIKIIKQAIDIQILNQLSFWDSLVISAAKSANCSVILTEDMNDGQVIDELRIQSPFTLKV